MGFFQEQTLRRRNLVASLIVAAVAGAGVSTVQAAITNGFSNPSNWTLNGNSASQTNGVPVISGGDLTLTTASNSEASSAWYSTPQDIADSWTATFTWQWSGTTNPADGFMFVAQNQGLSALGGGGGYKGYQATSPGSAAGGYAITPSYGVGVENFGSGNANNVSVGINGTIVTGGNNVANSTLDVNTDSNPINFTVSYNAAANEIYVAGVDTTNSADSFSYVYTGNSGNLAPSFNSATQVGANTAYVGFTGATGGLNEEQDFTNFNFTSGATMPANYQSPAYLNTVRTPIALTSSSFNQDVVVENSASLTTGGAIPSTVAMPVGQNSNALYESGLTVGGTVQSGGLPTSHQFVSQGDANTTFQFQKYTNTNNVLRLTSATSGAANPTSPTGTMTLATPTTFSTLAILALSGNGNPTGMGTVTLNFANGKSVTTDFYAPDWFTNVVNGVTTDGNYYGTALSGFGRIDVSNSGVNGLPTFPDMYETALNISHLGTDSLGDFVNASSYGALDSLTFTMPSNTGETNIFAVSGSAVSTPEPSAVLLLIGGAAAGLLLLRRRSQHVSA
jgi:hypothetical protein